MTRFINASGLLAIIALMSTPVFAASTIKSPLVEKGEAEIEIYSENTGDSDAAQDNSHELKLGLGYGVTDNWHVELETEWKQDAQDKMRHKAVALESIFQILPQGEYLVDLGFYGEYEFGTQAHSADEITFGPLLQSDIGNFRFTANPLISVPVGAHSGSEAPSFKYGLRAQYMLHPAFKPAVEFHGKMGEMVVSKTTDDQQHSVGPVISGYFPLQRFGVPGKIGYEAGMLFGLTSATPERNYKGKLEYEFAF